MAYRGGSQIDFTIDSSFQPFSMQEMLVPFTAYKDAFEKTEEAYLELSDKSDKFKYLSEQLPEGSKARQIYEGYANTLASQAEDLARNGLSMGNRRALTSLKRRYSGEIGRLDKAQTALEKEQALRREMGLKDSSMLYAANNFSIDDFLDGNTPNLYGISGTELYTRGAAAGKASSSRIVSAGDGGKTLGGYYRDYVQRMGYNADTIARFRADASAIPELQQTADAILQERGVLQNLTGNELERARQSVINGMIDGAIYQEQHSPQRDLGVMSASERDSSAQGWARIKLAQEEAAWNRKMDVMKLQVSAAKAGSSGSSSAKFPGYEDLSFVSGSGRTSAAEEISDRAKKVNIEARDGSYVVSVGSGSNKKELGSINTRGEFKKGKDLNRKNFVEYFGSTPWFSPNVLKSGYDSGVDDKNIESILRDVLEITEREGSQAYRNYNFYLEPDNSSAHNDGGGFYREPLGRLAGTTANGVIDTSDIPY
jgi:hypothetical protein